MWTKHVSVTSDFDGLTTQNLKITFHLWGRRQNHPFARPSVTVKSVKTWPFPPNDPDGWESYSQILPVNGAGAESNRSAVVAADWITPLFMQNSPERPTVGICQGRRSCRSFIREPQWRSLCSNTSFDSPACAAGTMTHNRQWLLFKRRHACSPSGVWF